VLRLPRKAHPAPKVRMMQPIVSPEVAIDNINNLHRHKNTITPASRNFLEDAVINKFPNEFACSRGRHACDTSRLFDGESRSSEELINEQMKICGGSFL